VTRADGRTARDARPVKLELGYLPYAEGSALITLGNTRVICSVSVDEAVPPFLRGKGVGWLTAEYRMLPRATHTRAPREEAGRITGRSSEIQRLIGRSLRAAIDRTRLGERTLVVDCDVLTADGGTRTAAITGAWVAVALACHRLLESGVILESPIAHQVAAISAGIVGGVALLDLTYLEDSNADVDSNAVLTNSHETVEFGLTSERALATDEQVQHLLQLTRLGTDQMFAAQRDALARLAPRFLDDVFASR